MVDRLARRGGPSEGQGDGGRGKEERSTLAETHEKESTAEIGNSRRSFHGFFLSMLVLGLAAEATLLVPAKLPGAGPSGATYSRF